MKKTTSKAVKIKSGNSATGLNKKAILRYKTADAFLSFVKEKEHVYASFGKNDDAVKQTWQEAQPKADAPKPKDK